MNYPELRSNLEKVPQERVFRCGDYVAHIDRKKGIAGIYQFYDATERAPEQYYFSYGFSFQEGMTRNDKENQALANFTIITASTFIELFHHKFDTKKPRQWSKQAALLAQASGLKRTEEHSFVLQIASPYGFVDLYKPRIKMDIPGVEGGPVEATLLSLGKQSYKPDELAQILALCANERYVGKFFQKTPQMPDNTRIKGFRP